MAAVQWALLYGHVEHFFTDVSAQAREAFVRSSQPLLLLPRGDDNRTAVFGDPLYGVLKVLRLQCLITRNTWDIPADTAAQVRLSPRGRLIDQVTLFSEEATDQKLDTLLSFLQRDNRIWNRMQQRLLLQYFSGEEQVLELGPTKHCLLQHTAFRRFQTCFSFQPETMLCDTLIVHSARTLLDILRERADWLQQSIDLLLVSNHQSPALSMEEKNDMANWLREKLGYRLLDARPEGVAEDALECHQLWIRLCTSR